MNHPFYSRLSYSIGNEDWKTEHAALKIKPKDSIFAVTASGDRPLNLLSAQCHQIVAVDANPSQNALCDLKRVALQELDYDAYLEFLGVKPSLYRISTYKRLEKTLLPESVHYWRRHLRKIEQGILYQGYVERFLRYASHIIRMLLGKNINTLFEIKNLHEQKSFIEQKWNEKIWKKVLEYALNPLTVRFFLKDPGLYAYVDEQFKMPHYIHDRLLAGIKSFPIRENIIISLICFGKVFEEGFSPYLTKEGTEMIQKQSAKLTLKTSNATSFLESCKEDSFDCFSFSDIASYMAQNDFHRLCYALVKTARSGARFCIRQLLTSYDVPEELSPYLQRDEELEFSLEKEDRCCIYRFLVGRVIK